jgi:hypothetical protein
MAETYITEKDAIISVTLYTSDGNGHVTQVSWPADIKSWKTFEGGDPVASTSQMIPGNLMPAIARPGPVKRSSVTVTLPYSVAIDALRPQIDAGTNQRMVASYQPKDADGNINGKLTTRTGICKQPQFPKWDAESGNDAMLGLVMECDT